MSKNQQASLVKPIAAVYTPKLCKIFTVNPLCVSKLNKLVFNQYLMFRFINIWPKSSNASLGEGSNV